jgi:hypothetical protein
MIVKVNPATGEVSVTAPTRRGVDAALAFARGEVVAPERAEPAYLRDNVALTLVQQQALRAAR